MESALPICRVCLKTSLEYIDFETPFETEDSQDAQGLQDTSNLFTYLDCFRECTQLDVSECLVGQSVSLCDACGLELRVSYEFLQKARKADKIMQLSLKHKDSLQDASDDEVSTDFSPAQQAATTNEASPEDTSTMAEEEEIVYECDYCEETFFSQFVLNLHIKRMHKEQIIIKTNATPGKSNTETIDKEMGNDTSNNAGKEDDEENYDMEILDDALEDDEEKMGFRHFVMQALNEEESTTNNSNLDTETLQKDLEGDLVCAVCKVTFASESILREHECQGEKKKNGETSKNQCRICGQQLPKWQLIREHMQAAHAHIVKCTKCDHKCRESKLREHDLKMHGENTEFTCDTCSKSFQSQGTLNAHLKYHQRKEANVKSDACEICGKHFSTQTYLRQHMGLHKKQRDLLQCGICSKKYLSKTSLEGHLRMHKGETIECELCGKHFSRSYELKVHMRFHLGVYPFECDICGRKFSIKSHLRTHMWRHQGLKLQCEECGKLFTSTKALHEHSFRHTEMPFPCSYCSKGYPSKQKYKAHLKTMHAVDLNDEEMQKFPKSDNPKALKKRKLTLVQADSVMKEVEIKCREDDTLSIEVDEFCEG